MVGPCWIYAVPTRLKQGFIITRSHILQLVTSGPPEYSEIVNLDTVLSQDHGRIFNVPLEAMPELHAFADAMVRDLPPEGEVVLPDWVLGFCSLGMVEVWIGVRKCSAKHPCISLADYYLVHASLQHCQEGADLLGAYDADPGWGGFDPAPKAKAKAKAKASSGLGDKHGELCYLFTIEKTTQSLT